MYKQRLQSTEMSITEYRDVAYVQYRDVLIPYHMTGRHDSVSLYLSNDLFQWLENEH